MIRGSSSVVFRSVDAALGGCVVAEARAEDIGCVLSTPGADVNVHYGRAGRGRV